MRNSLGSAVNYVLKWGREAFIASASSFLVVAHLDSQFPQLEWAVIPLACASVVTLPFAAVTVWRDSDRASKRNWIVLIVLCLLIITAATIWHVPA